MAKIENFTWHDYAPQLVIAGVEYSKKIAGTC